VDGSDIEDLLDLLPLERTAFNVITKSGTTIETMGSFFVVRERLLAAFGEEGYRARVVATTDPAAGELRKLVDREGLTSLPVPPGVGGRFSVLTAVGLLPLAAAGVDIRALLRGAAAARANALTASDNVALDFARIHVALVEAGVTDLVFMPYAQVLSDTSLWFVQLWAESLGKQRPDGSRVGPTPIAAVGAVDQHSQLQLFMEGPANKAVCFVDAGPNSSLRVPAFGDACPPLAHLAGRTFDELRQAELRGVRAGLIEAGRGVSTITIPAVTAETMGALFFLLESATAMAGWMLGVEPFDQPGVEAGKRFAHGLLGQASYAGWAERAQAFESGDRKTSGF
jgi:glucose-6-phosphate isomerase